MKLQCFKSGGPCRGEVPFRPRQVFAAYPFDVDHHWLFDEVVRPVIEGLKGPTGRYNLKLKDARAQTETRDFMCSIAEEIWSSRFAIIDLSRENANVSFELGLIVAHAQTDMKRKFVIISSFEERLPTDIASINVVKYAWNALGDFKERLEAACLDTFKNAAPAPPAPLPTLGIEPVGVSQPHTSLAPLAPSNAWRASPSQLGSTSAVGLDPELLKSLLGDSSGSSSKS